MNKDRDPFINWLKKWKWRIEDASYFLLHWLHLILILIIAVSLLFRHIDKLNDEVPIFPEISTQAKNTFY